MRLVHVYKVSTCLALWRKSHLQVNKICVPKYFCHPVSSGFLRHRISQEVIHIHLLKAVQLRYASSDLIVVSPVIFSERLRETLGDAMMTVTPASQVHSVVVVRVAWTEIQVAARWQFKRNKFDLSFSLKTHLSFGLRFPTLRKSLTRGERPHNLRGRVLEGVDFSVLNI